MNSDLDQPAEAEGAFEPQQRLKLDSARRLDAGATPKELVAELVSTYGVPEPRASKDVEDFLHALRDRSLLLIA
jgi:hypothetical protein